MGKLLVSVVSIPSSLADPEDSFQFDLIALNSVVLSDALLEHLSKLPCLKNNLFEMLLSGCQTPLLPFLYRSYTRDNAYRRVPHQSFLVSSTALDPISQDFFPGSNALGPILALLSLHFLLPIR